MGDFIQFSWRSDAHDGAYDKGIQEFLDLHYGCDDGHYGFVHVACRQGAEKKMVQDPYKHTGISWEDFMKKVESGECKKSDWVNPGYETIRHPFKTIGFWKTTQKFPFDYKQKKAYYITANTFNHGKDKTKNKLLSICNFVVDLDFHNYGKYNGIDIETYKKVCFWLEFALKQRYMENPQFPLPNTYVLTGRGIQLWWRVESIPYKKFRYVYEDISEMLAKEVDIAVSSIDDYIRCLHQDLGSDMDIVREEDTYASLLKNLKVDFPASKRAAGFFRMPGSFNINTKTRGAFYIAHKDRLNAVELFFQRHEPTGKKYVKRKRKYTAINNFAEDRTEKLLQLIDYRKKNNMDLEGYRDKFCFIVFAAYISSGHDTDSSYKAAFRVNKKFKKPLPEEEIVSCMSTCERKKYWIRNATIKTMLDITEEEADMLELYDSKTEYIYAKKREEKRVRNIWIYYYKDVCRNQREIAALVGCNQSTVCRVLQKECPFSQEEIASVVCPEKPQQDPDITENLGLMQKKISHFSESEMSTFDAIVEKLSNFYSHGRDWRSDLGINKVIPRFSQYFSMNQWISEQFLHYVHHPDQVFSSDNDRKNATPASILHLLLSSVQSIFQIAESELSSA